jgi:hypothetical protein
MPIFSQLLGSERSINFKEDFIKARPELWNEDIGV